jgi:AcrR family transcriptional regulator
VPQSEQEDDVGAPRSSRIAERRSAALADGGADYSSRRAELIRVAANVFREKGYAAATLNDVAAVLGTDRASLYYYVGSKEELFQECITAVVTDNIAKADALSAMAMSPRDRLFHLIELLITSQVEHYPYMYVYMQEDMRRVVSEDAAWATEMVEATHRIEGYFISAIKDGIADGSFRNDLSTTLMANSLFGMTQWTHRWFVPGEKYTAEDLIHTFATIFFAGIDNPDASISAQAANRPKRAPRTAPDSETAPKKRSRKAAT